MECSIGITGNGFTVLATDMSAGRNVFRMKEDLDKQKVIGNTLIIGYSGEAGDTNSFVDYVEANLVLDTFRHEQQDLLPGPCASWIRRQLATAIRSRRPYMVNLVVGGYDKTAKEPHLYTIDFYGTMAKVGYTATGYGSIFALSAMDARHTPECTLDEALQLLSECISEIERRLMINMGDFKARVVDENGIREVEIPKTEKKQLGAPLAAVPSTTGTVGVVA